MNQFIKIIFYTIILFFTQSAFSTTVYIYNKSTLESIEGVSMYIQQSGKFYDEMQTSNRNIPHSTTQGEIDIPENLDTNSIFFFSHNQFFDYTISCGNLSRNGFKVYLIERMIPLEEFVFSVQRFSEKKKDIIPMVASITPQDIKLFSSPNMADILQNSGEVFVQKSQLGGGSPTIRGFEANKVLLVVDGVRMNNAIYRGGHLQNVLTLDQAVLEKTEIVFGPGSVVYGSDALGGVMHFITRTPTPTGTDKIITKANAYIKMGSALHERTYHSDVEIRGKKWGWLSSYTNSEFGDLITGRNRNPFYGNFGQQNIYVQTYNNTDYAIQNTTPHVIKNTGYSQADFLQKLVFKPNKLFQHIINFQLSATGNINRNDRLSEMTSGQIPKFAEWYYGPQKRTLLSYTLHLNKPICMYDAGKIIAATQWIEESRYSRKFNKTNRDGRVEKVFVTTVNADFKKQFRRNEFKYGAEIFYNSVNSTAASKNIITGDIAPLDTRYPDGGSYMYSGAVYIMHNYEYKKWVFNDGLRLTRYALHSQLNDTTFFKFPFTEINQKNTNLTASGGVIYNTKKGTKISMGINSGFRAPNVDDVAKIFESAGGRLIVPNNLLKPEYIYNSEIGVQKVYNKKLQAGINIYYSIYKDAITTARSNYQGNDSVLYNGTQSAVYTQVNSGKAMMYGVSLNLKANPTENFSIYTTLNYTYGRIKTDSTPYPMDHIPPLFGKTTFKINRKKFIGDCTLLYNGWKRVSDFNMSGEDNFDYATLHGMPAWYIINLRASYQFNQKYSLQIVCENLTDQNYRTFGSGISAPGRNFIVTVRANL